MFENDGNVVVHQATVLKKMMYYTMRVRRAQRQFDELKAKLRQQRKNQIHLPEERIHVLTHMLRNVSIQFVHKLFFLPQYLDYDIMTHSPSVSRWSVGCPMYNLLVRSQEYLKT